MVDILHRIAIAAPLPRVYEALSTVDGIARWWTKDTTGSSELGGRIAVQFHSPKGVKLGAMLFELADLTPNRAVRWRMLEGPDEWLGTEVNFELTTSGEQCVVLFAHRDWQRVSEFTHHCSTKWATFLLSLKELLETGVGRPAPADLKIDDWN